ncbi:MAG: cyanophycin synthetase, partial [Planctomycetota bacterium]
VPMGGAERGGVVRVYDDYGHHPTEIETTLRALREHDRPEERGGRLICVFQPHQHSRTRFFMEEFASAFGQADVVVVPEIYFVRDSEQERTRVSAGDLVEKLRDRGVRAMHLHPFGAIVEQLENLCRPGDLLVVMGAGPVWRIARDYMSNASTGRAPGGTKATVARTPDGRAGTGPVGGGGASG